MEIGQLDKIITTIVCFVVGNNKQAATNTSLVFLSLSRTFTEL